MAMRAFGQSSRLSKRPQMRVTSRVQKRHLNLHEYQSKELLDRFGLRTQRWRLASNAKEAVEKARELDCKEYVVKSQILAGGRGKGHFDNGFQGGVHICDTPEEVGKLTDSMIGHRLVTKQTVPEGVKVKNVMVVESIVLAKELYLSIIMDRGSGGPVIIASTEGGMDIEQVAEETPEKIIQVPVDIDAGPTKEQLLSVAKALGLEDPVLQEDAMTQVDRLFKLFVELDATQVEINPLAIRPENDLYCVDAKINFDDNAAFRHKEIFAQADTSEDDPREVEAAKYNLNYVGLDGNIGCMVNGAGLAMATMDIIKLYKGEPANFLDVGGSADEHQVTEAFKILTSDKKVKAILVNIFGGIMRCDVIASGVVAAARNVGLQVPLIVRLEGTNVEQGMEILRNSGIQVTTAVDLDDAAQKAVASISGQ